MNSELRRGKWRSRMIKCSMLLCHHLIWNLWKTKESMPSFCNRKRILSLAIVLYFSIYAASPLLCVYAIRSSESLHAAGTGSAYRTDSHIFLYELICLTLESKHSKEKPQPIAGVLLLKKRAILSDDKVSNLIRLADIAKLNEHLTFFSDPSLSLSRLSTFSSYDNYPLLFSGLSPPQST